MSEHPAPPLTPGLQRLLRMSRKELAQAMQGGGRVERRAHADTLFRGVSLGLPVWVERLTWKTFGKTIRLDAETGEMWGWNIRLEQTGIEGPLRPKQKGGRPVVFGHYAVLQTEQGLLLDYGAGPNPPLDPTRLVRDPVVELEPGLLLGRTWLQLGSLRIDTPSWFALQPAGPLDLLG